MAEHLVLGALIGLAFAELLKAVKNVKAKVSRFEPYLVQLESKLESISSVIKEIQQLNTELGREEELNKLLKILKDGKALVDKCLTIWKCDLRSKFRHEKQLGDLNASLTNFFTIDMQAQSARDGKQTLLTLKSIQKLMKLPLINGTEEITGSSSGSAPVPAQVEVEVEVSESKSNDHHSMQLAESASKRDLLLHGNLYIRVDGATNLPKSIRNVNRGRFVSLSVSGAVIGRTSEISNTENPVWKEHFCIPVAHYTDKVYFLVENQEQGVMSSELFGTVAIPVQKIYSGAKVEGTFPILNSSGTPSSKQGAVLELFIRYIPMEKLTIYHQGVGAGIPNTYFPLRKGGNVTFYQDAHVPSSCLPKVRLDLNHKVYYVHGRCWEDILYALLGARHFIYISGRSVSHKVRLVQDSSKASATGHTG